MSHGAFHALTTIQSEIAPFLLSLLQAEVEHEAQPDLIRRHRHPDVRDLCGKRYVYVSPTMDLIGYRLLLDITVFGGVDVSILWVGNLQ
jgi:hypothetical protein